MGFMSVPGHAQKNLDLAAPRVLAPFWRANSAQRLLFAILSISTVYTRVYRVRRDRKAHVRSHPNVRSMRSQGEGASEGSELALPTKGWILSGEQKWCRMCPKSGIGLRLQ